MAVVALAAPATAAPLRDRVLLSVGHTDALALRWESDQLVMAVKDDTGDDPVFRDPDDVLFQALPGSHMTVPPGLPPEFAFLGPAGSDIWLLPQVQDMALLWPGWSTESLPPGVFSGGVEFRLLGVEGPGKLITFQNGPFGEPIIRFNSQEPLPQAIPEMIPAHTHFNWVFGAPGLYTITFEGRGTLVDGGAQVSTGPVDYQFYVGDLADLPMPALSVTGATGDFHPGETVTLTAVQDPVTDLDHYHWFSKCPDDEDFSVVPGEGTGTYDFTAILDLEHCEYLVRLYGPNHVVVSESAPVELHVHPVTELTVTGATGEFHPGETVTLTAVQDPVTDLDHYHWFSRCPGDEDFSVVPGEGTGTYDFTAAVELEHCEYQARLYTDDHVEAALSEPVELHVHQATDLTISGAEEELHPGETVVLTAVQDPVTDLDHYHWFVRCPPASEFTVVPAEGTGTWDFRATGALEGCDVQVRLYGAGHAVVAASAPVTLHVHTPDFPDVDPTSTFAADIEWLAGTGITVGYPDGDFRPTLEVSRQAMAAFLYRFDGWPLGTDPQCETAPFPDVPVDHEFCGEIAWLADQGITTGDPTGAFQPGTPVSRQAMAAFLYRLEGAPEGPDPQCQVAPFDDVPVGHEFCGEVAWLAATGVAGGYGDGDFRPTLAVSRQAMAAFLHRLADLAPVS